MNESIQLLPEKRDALIAEKEKLIYEFDERISALTKTISLLGGNPNESKGAYVDISAYDDEIPGSIRGAEDGI